MKEIQGDLWNYYRKPGYIICITTNGTLKSNGEGVMGRGCAKEALTRIPGISRILGEGLRAYGNKFQFGGGIAFFPVKHNWWEKADMDLIQRSAQLLNLVARDRPNTIYVLPRPGCGNGQRTWEEVKPFLTDLPDNVLVISPDTSPGG